MKTQIITTCLLGILITLPHSPALAQQGKGLDSDSVLVLAKSFVNLLSEEKFAMASKTFDSTMNAVMPTKKLGQTWKALLGQVGPFQRQLRIRQEKVQEYDVVFVSCEFKTAPIDIKVVFNGKRQVAGLFFLPAPSIPQMEAQSPNDRELIIGKGDWALPGTLSIPNGTGPFPAVVLVHGSGPSDRDGTIGPNKPLRDLAQGLTSKGIAVLRYEKRSKEHAAKLAHLKESITVKEETIDDALLAVAALREIDRIAPKKIFVLGHSLGGMLIPRIGALDTRIAGFIVMAGPSRPLEDIILEQMNHLFSLSKNLSADEKAQLAAIRLQVANVKNPKLSPTTPAANLPLGIPAKYWLDLRGYNPPEAAKNLNRPILILQGERDYQATMEDFAGWRKHLSSKPDAAFRSYPKLNHLFMEGEGKSTPQEYTAEGHVA